MIWQGQAGLSEFANGAGGRWYRVTQLDDGPLITARWRQLHSNGPGWRSTMAASQRACELFEARIAILPEALALRVFPGWLLSDETGVSAWHRKLHAEIWALEFAR